MRKMVLIGLLFLGACREDQLQTELLSCQSKLDQQEYFLKTRGFTGKGMEIGEYVVLASHGKNALDKCQDAAVAFTKSSDTFYWCERSAK